MKKNETRKVRVTTFMMESGRIFPIVLDMDDVKKVSTDIRFKQYDYGTSFIDAQLISQKAPLSVAGKRIVGIFKDSKGSVITNMDNEPLSSRASILLEDNGVVRVPIPKDIIITVGEIECEIIIYNSNNSRLTSPRFNFHIEESLLDYEIQPVDTPVSGEVVCGEAICGGVNRVSNKEAQTPVVKSFLSENLLEKIRGIK